MQLVTVLFVHLENFKINKEKLNAFSVLKVHIVQLLMERMVFHGTAMGIMTKQEIIM